MRRTSRFVFNIDNFLWTVERLASIGNLFQNQFCSVRTDCIGYLAKDKCTYDIILLMKPAENTFYDLTLPHSTLFRDRGHNFRDGFGHIDI